MRFAKLTSNADNTVFYFINMDNVASASAPFPAQTPTTLVMVGGSPATFVVKDKIGDILDINVGS